MIYGFIEPDQESEEMMKKFSKDFTLRVDGVVGTCPAGEAWADDQITKKKIPVLSCEGPCIRGDIARRAANFVAKEAPFERACYAEALFVPHSSMARWVKQADQVIMIEGCFLQCIGRVVNNVVDKEKIIHVDALSLYHKYTDLFDMEDVPEAERIATARQVADRILSQLSNIREPEKAPETKPLVGEPSSMST